MMKSSRKLNPEPEMENLNQTNRPSRLDGASPQRDGLEWKKREVAGMRRQSGQVIETARWQGKRRRTG